MKPLLPLFVAGLLVVSCISVPGVGHQGEPCDDSGGCLPGIYCINELCVEAGGLNQPCRPNGDMCDNGLLCTGGTCTDAPCTGGTYQCIGDTLQFCNQGAWNDVTDCDPGLCNPVAGRCDSPPVDGDDDVVVDGDADTMDPDPDDDIVVDGDTEEGLPEMETELPETDGDTDTTDYDTTDDDTTDTDLVETEADIADPEPELEAEQEIELEEETELEEEQSGPCTCFTTDFCCDGCYPVNEREYCDDNNANTDSEVCFYGTCMQAPAHLWSMGLAPNHENGGAVVTDSALDNEHNVYITGHFNGIIDLGNGEKSGGDNKNVFVASYTPQGALRYAVAYAATGDQMATCISVDADDGEAYVGGWFTHDFNPGGNHQLTNQGGQDAFLIRLSASGSVVWAKSWGDSADNQRINDVVVTNMGDVYIVGAFSGTMNFGEFISDISATSQGAFVAALHDDGEGFWVNTIASEDGIQEATAIDITMTGYLAVGGQYTGAPSFKGTVFPNALSDDIFVVTVRSNNDSGWVKTFQANGQDSLEGLSVAGDNDVLVCGSYANKSPFDGEVNSAGGTDPWIATLRDIDGEVEWYNDSGTTGDDSFTDCTSNAFGRVFMAGHLGGPMVVNMETLTPSGAGDVFMASYENIGYKWAVLWGNESAEQFGLTISADDYGRVYIGGSFEGTMDLGDGIIYGDTGNPNGFFGSYFADPTMNISPGE